MQENFNREPFYKQKDLTAEEISWLTEFVKLAFKEKIKDMNVLFTDLETKEKVSVILPYDLLSKIEKDTIPKKFQYNPAIMTVITKKKKNPTYFMNIEFLYWFLNRIDDFLGYKDILDRVFSNAMFGDDVWHDKETKSYKLKVIHLEKAQACKDMKPIEKTILLGFAIFIGLFRDANIKSLKEIYDGFKDKTLKDIGLTFAQYDAFGKTGHYTKLNLCWNCGDEIETMAGLCKDCDKYWDEKTK